jgi:hypothetical protein
MAPQKACSIVKFGRMVAPKKLGITILKIFHSNGEIAAQLFHASLAESRTEPPFEYFDLAHPSWSYFPGRNHATTQDSRNFLNERLLEDEMCE